MKFLNSILSAFVIVSASAALEDTKVEKEFNNADFETALANEPFFKRGLSSSVDLDSNVKRNLNGSPPRIFPLEYLKAAVANVGSLVGIPFTETSQYAGMKYDVQVVPVEASCKSMDLDGYGCEEDDYGSDTMHSGYVYIPVVKGEDNQHRIINARKLSTWFQFPAANLSQEDSNLVATQPGLAVAEYAWMAASNGYVAFVPQKTGFGTSSNLVPTETVKKSIVTSSLPLYAWVENYIKEQSNGMTKLDNKAVYAGYSSGGYAAVAAADGFKKHGIKPNQVLASTLPARLESWGIMGIVRSISNGKYKNFSPFLVAANTVALSELYGANIIDSNLTSDYISIFQSAETPSFYDLEGGWFNSTLHGSNAATLGALLPYTSIFGPYPAPNNFDPEVYAHYKAAFDNGISDPCGKTGMGYITYTENVANVCMAAIENSLTKIMQKAKYPIDVCMMQDDPLVAFENGVEPKNGKFIKLPFQGNHISGNVACIFALFSGFEMNPQGTKAPKAMKGSKAPKSMKGTKSPKGTKAPKAPK